MSNTVNVSRSINSSSTNYSAASAAPKKLSTHQLTALFNKLRVAPEAHWNKINDSHLRLNLEPRLKEVEKKGLFNSFFSSDLKNYLNHIHRAQQAFQYNQLQKTNFNDNDIKHINKARTLVAEPSDQASLSYFLAQAHSLRHLTESSFLQSLKSQNLTALSTDKFHAEVSILSTREAIEHYQTSLTELFDCVTDTLLELEHKERASPKCLEALNTLQDSLKQLHKSMTSEKTTSYNILEAVKAESNALASIAHQIYVLEDMNMAPDLTKEIKNNIKALIPLYFLQATEYERLADIYHTSLIDTTKGSYLGKKTCDEYILYAFRDYMITKKLVKEQQEQATYLEERIKTKLFIKTGVWEDSLNEDDKSVRKLRKEQNSLNEIDSLVTSGLNRLELLLQSRIELSSQARDILKGLGLTSVHAVAENKPASAVTRESTTYDELNDQAQFYISNNNPIKALEIYKKIYTQWPSYDLLLTLAQLCKATNHLQEALHYYNLVLAKDPNNIHVRKLLNEIKNKI